VPAELMLGWSCHRQIPPEAENSKAKWLRHTLMLVDQVKKKSPSLKEKGSFGYCPRISKLNQPIGEEVLPYTDN